MRVRFARRAIGDLSAILEYIGRHSRQGRVNVRRALQRTFDLIGAHPMIGRPSGELETRVIPVSRYPYLVYWLIEADEVVIVHIRHAARRPWSGEDSTKP